jgi:4-amino-4-deoxy-L-arabinose transferase-like glycosyltransferase
MPQQRKWIAYALLLATAFSFRLAVARFLPNDTPEDGKVYARMARNLLEQHVYSHASEPPYLPSIIRLPGYPLFLAAVYSIFGHYNNTAVRLIQAGLDTITCALIAMLACYWEPNERRKRTAGIAALALALVCPFTTIYVATILTETWASLLAVLLCLLATLAFRARVQTRAWWLWLATGLVGGLGVFFRPDSGLFVAAVGLTLVVSGLLWQGDQGTSKWRPRFWRVVVQGLMLSVAFALVLTPWTIRNWRTFHLVQPLSPTHGEMPGEFVPRGYLDWVRSWIDDRKYIDPMIWSLDDAQIDVDELPPGAFDSEAEKARVSDLIDRYNNPAQDEEPATTETPAATPSPTPASGQPSKDTAASADKDAKADAKGDENDEQDEAQATETPEPVIPEMTPAIDAGFGQIAQERIKRAPLRYYLWLPLRRSRSLWFGPHADYYPFNGELFPLADLDHSTHQHLWLPLFTGLVWLYSLLGVAGAWCLWRTRNDDSRRWLLLVMLVIFLRLAFFSTMENPEPRYTVEIFPFLTVLGGIAIARFKRVRQT